MLKLGCVAVMLLSCSALRAQVVAVSEGQTITQSDLEAGIFAGQPFSLGPQTTFLVQGTVSELGGPLMFPYDDPFDVQGSVFELGAEAVLAASPTRPTLIRDVDLRLGAGASMGRTVQFFSSSEEMVGMSLSTRTACAASRTGRF